MRKWRKLKSLSKCHNGYQVQYIDYTREGKTHSVYFVKEEMGQAFVDELNQAHQQGKQLPLPPPRSLRTKTGAANSLGIHRNESGYLVVRGRGMVYFKNLKQAREYRVRVVEAMDAKCPYPPIPTRQSRGLPPLTAPITPVREPYPPRTDGNL